METFDYQSTHPLSSRDGQSFFERTKFLERTKSFEKKGPEEDER